MGRRELWGGMALGLLGIGGSGVFTATQLAANTPMQRLVLIAGWSCVVTWLGREPINDRSQGEGQNVRHRVDSSLTAFEDVSALPAVSRAEPTLTQPNQSLGNPFGCQKVAHPTAAIALQLS